MKNILLLMGGVSTEHDISLITGIQTINNIDKNKYAIYPVVIDKQGKWHFSKTFESIGNIKNYFEKKRFCETILYDKTLYIKHKNKLKKQAYIDCVLFCLHGGTGENGAIQGFLESMGMPYTSPEHTFSGIFMNKYLSKILFEKLGIESVKCIKIDKNNYATNKNEVLKNIANNISAPYFVKPNSQGSSIGIGVSKSKRGLQKLIDTAFCFDDEVLVEETVNNLYELNIAVAKKNGKIVLSMIEKPSNKNKILSFDDKYLSRGKSGLDNMGRELPANISKEIESYIKDCATKIYANFIKLGVVRIDFLVDGKSNKVYVGEVNTIPGSLSYYLWEGQMTFGELIDELINNAIISHNKKAELMTTFNSSVLDGFDGLKCGTKL